MTAHPSAPTSLPTAGSRIGSLCTGYGGLDMGVQELLGGSVAWISDIDPGASRILAHHYPNTPNLGDVTAIDWTHVEPVDVVIGGYPCQPFSVAGQRKGTADERHIWPHIAHALRVLRPGLALFENVAGHLRLGFDTVLADLAAIGFDAEWVVVRADEVGAPHQRKRLFLLAVSTDARSQGLARRWTGRPAPDRCGDASDTADFGRAGSRGAWGRRSRSAHRGLAVADTEGVGRAEGGPEPARQQRRSDAAERGSTDWGRYAAAIERWERVTGRPAPSPVDDRGRLAPEFAEWMMGVPSGHITAVPGLSRTAQLKAIGNGVVPAQAAHALRILLHRADVIETIGVAA